MKVCDGVKMIILYLFFVFFVVVFWNYRNANDLHQYFVYVTHLKFLEKDISKIFSHLKPFT